MREPGVGGHRLFPRAVRPAPPVVRGTRRAAAGLPSLPRRARRPPPRPSLRLCGALRRPAGSRRAPSERAGDRGAAFVRDAAGHGAVTWGCELFYLALLDVVNMPDVENLQ